SRRAAAGILEPIYEKLESWSDLVKVHEIQLRHAQGSDRRIGLLMRIGELHATKLGNAPDAFDAFARAFNDDPSRGEVRAELERIGVLLDDGWKRLVDLYEPALARPLEPALMQDRSLQVASAYDERLDGPGKAIEQCRRGVSSEREDATALEALDRLFSRDEKWGDLLDIYRKKVELTRDPTERLNLLFRIASLWEEMLGTPEEAIVTYREILGHDPMNLRALKALDRLYLAQQHWRDLADNLVRQLALVADDREDQVRLLVRLAELRERQLKEVAAAVDTYRQVLELQPDHEVATRALERLLADAEHQREHELTIAQILEPIYKTRNDWQKQIGVYEIMVPHAYDPPPNIDPLHTIGELWEIGGDDADQA